MASSANIVPQIIHGGALLDVVLRVEPGEVRSEVMAADALPGWVEAGEREAATLLLGSPAAHPALSAARTTANATRVRRSNSVDAIEILHDHGSPD